MTGRLENWLEFIHDIWFYLCRQNNLQRPTLNHCIFVKEMKKQAWLNTRSCHYQKMTDGADNFKHQKEYILVRKCSCLQIYSSCLKVVKVLVLLYDYWQHEKYKCKKNKARKMSPPHKENVFWIPCSIRQYLTVFHDIIISYSYIPSPEGKNRCILISFLSVS